MCFPSKDYLLRVSFTKNDAVHIANYINKWDGVIVLSACGLTNVARYDLHRTKLPVSILPGTMPITCKRCLKAIGDTDYTKKENTDLFVVRNSDGLFLKDVCRYDIQFCESPENAHVFRSWTAAEKYACEYYTVDSNGDEISYEEYGGLPYPRPSFRSRLKKGWEIKRVEIKLVGGGIK